MGGFVRKLVKTFSKPSSPIKKVQPQIQKAAVKAAPKGPTSVEMANQINVDNKRKGRKITNLTAKKTLDKDYKLNEKTLLG